ncbi:MAG: hypothetical protein ACRDVC_10935 [Acidimicrobiales bacterium]
MAVVVILAVAIAPSISILIARDAVTTKINSARLDRDHHHGLAEGIIRVQRRQHAANTTEITSLLGLKDVTSVQESLSEEL